MKTTKKKRCWACESLNTIKWGKQKKRQRFKCKDCGILFTSKNEAVKLSNPFSWFKKWVICNYSANLGIKGFSSKLFCMVFSTGWLFFFTVEM